VIVDTSAVLAIVFQERGYERLIGALVDASACGMAAPSVAEASIVLTARLGSRAPGLIERFLQQFRIEVVPFGDAHVGVATDAFRRFGKGRHAAGLNFGDCKAYAVAKVADVPLLYVGEDFSHTDLAPAIAPATNP
jgi:ribonuclease VapC